jgi:trimeric autotransporter adhesin
LTDTIPTNTSIFVQSSANYPEPAFTFTDGTGAAVSGLSFVYSGPASITDDVEFSNNNGSDFNYLPTPDSDGFDSQVTDVRINPQGIFNPSNGTDIPTFTVNFSVRVD